MLPISGKPEIQSRLQPTLAHMLPISDKPEIGGLAPQ
jgi:hypothetical protein